jgi:hypothetical protein
LDLRKLTHGIKGAATREGWQGAIGRNAVFTLDGSVEVARVGVGGGKKSVREEMRQIIEQMTPLAWEGDKARSLELLAGV